MDDPGFTPIDARDLHAEVDTILARLKPLPAGVQLSVLQHAMARAILDGFRPLDGRNAALNMVLMLLPGTVAALIKNRGDA